jgi:subtilisin family serine protease
MRWALGIVAVALTWGCSNAPVRVESRALPRAPEQAPASPAPGSPAAGWPAPGSPAASSERFIIAAVENDSAPLLPRVGSTPRGYDTITAYGATSSAIKLLRSIESEYGLREVNAWPIEPLHMHCAVLQVAEGTDRTNLLAKLSHDPRIKLAQPLQDFATRSLDYNDPYIALQSGFREMDVAEAHALSQGEGVKIAIIDTGADTEHPDLARSIAGAENFVDSDTEQFRRDRHGTEIAGVIAAVANNREGIVGVAPASRLLILKACWQAQAGADAARCNSFTLARALVAALDAHAQVVNLSLAGPDDPLLSGLIREGVRRGVLFVGAASGAEANAGLMHQPGVIEVSGSEDHAALASVLYAPGREILTLLPGGHYDFASGDSISTAQVTGVVALLLSKDRRMSGTVAYQLLRGTSSHSGTAVGESEHVDACAAVVTLVGRGTCNTPDAGHRLVDQQAPVQLH